MRGILLVDVKAEVTPDAKVTGPEEAVALFAVTMILLVFACPPTLVADDDVMMSGCLLVLD